MFFFCLGSDKWSTSDPFHDDLSRVAELWEHGKFYSDLQTESLCWPFLGMYLVAPDQASYPG